MPPLKKSLPIGMETFTDILPQNMYYVDKTNFISDLLENKSIINHFTRPRRFGKTLNMDMLRTFFEPDHDHTIFQNLNISKNNSLCTSHMGKYPVISLSLKGVINITFSGARYMLSTCLAEEFRRHDYLSNSPHISVIEKIKFEQYCKMDIEPIEPDDSLRFLSILLNKHHTQKVIVLIDEYDVPLDKAHQYGYYDEMISLIRNTLSQVLKTNNSLFFAVLTGCLRISKESVFTIRHSLLQEKM